MTTLRALLEEAGFSGHGLDLAVAVAMAESGGHANAHNTNVNTGDNSYGLFQINMLGDLGPERLAAYHLASNDALFDPLTNAKVAFRLSNGGRDWTPWSTYKSGAYEAYLGPNVDTEVTGASDLPSTSTGTADAFTMPTGHSLASVDALSVHQAEALAYDVGLLGQPPATSGIGTSTGTAHPDALQTFLHAATAQIGDPYVFGAKGPTAFDCSGLTAWAADQAGVQLPAGAAHQYVWLKQHGYLIPVDQAIHTPGALLFHFASEPQPGDGEPDVAHVAISRGDGKTIEAADENDGVVSWDAGGGRFNYAAVIPGISDGTVPASADGVDVMGTSDPLSPTSDPLSGSGDWNRFYDEIGAYSQQSLGPGHHGDAGGLGHDAPAGHHDLYLGH